MTIEEFKERFAGLPECKCNYFNEFMDLFCDIDPEFTFYISHFPDTNSLLTALFDRRPPEPLFPVAFKIEEILDLLPEDSPLSEVLLFNLDLF